jgi:hypothetical protein
MATDELIDESEKLNILQRAVDEVQDDPTPENNERMNLLMDHFASGQSQPYMSKLEEGGIGDDALTPGSSLDTQQIIQNYINRRPNEELLNPMLVDDSVKADFLRKKDIEHAIETILRHKTGGPVTIQQILDVKESLGFGRDVSEMDALMMRGISQEYNNGDDRYQLLLDSVPPSERINTENYLRPYTPGNEARVLQEMEQASPDLLARSEELREFFNDLVNSVNAGEFDDDDDFVEDTESEVEDTGPL